MRSLLAKTFLSFRRDPWCLWEESLLVPVACDRSPGRQGQPSSAFLSFWEFVCLFCSFSGENLKKLLKWKGEMLLLGEKAPAKWSQIAKSLSCTLRSLLLFSFSCALSTLRCSGQKERSGISRVLFKKCLSHFCFLFTSLGVVGPFVARRLQTITGMWKVER